MSGFLQRDAPVLGIEFQDADADAITYLRGAGRLRGVQQDVDSFVEADEG